MQFCLLPLPLQPPIRASCLHLMKSGCASQLNIVPVRSNFPVPKGHNANFVWNQYETCGADFVRK